MDKKNKNNPFRTESGGRIEKTKKEAEWGKVKFNPVAKIAITESATPWSHFKNEIIQKNRDDQHELRGNFNNPNAKQVLKKREETHRRHLIESKRNEPTQWEDFNEEPQETEKPKKAKAEGKFQKLRSNVKDIESIPKGKFDSKMLTSEQNLYLKRVITSHIKQKGTTFDMAVKDMKRNGVKRQALRK